MHLSIIVLHGCTYVTSHSFFPNNPILIGYKIADGPCARITNRAKDLDCPSPSAFLIITDLPR